MRGRWSSMQRYRIQWPEIEREKWNIYNISKMSSSSPNKEFNVSRIRGKRTWSSLEKVYSSSRGISAKVLRNKANPIKKVSRKRRLRKLQRTIIRKRPSMRWRNFRNSILFSISSIRRIILEKAPHGRAVNSRVEGRADQGSYKN